MILLDPVGFDALAHWAPWFRRLFAGITTFGNSGIYLVPLGGDDPDSDGPHYDPADLRENPEESLLRHESQQEAAGSVDKFLTNLRGNVRGKIKQYNRMLGVLWHCYLSTDHATQLEVAATLGVSDSLVSDYRRRIEQELRALSFTEVEEARMFELALRERVRTMVPVDAEVMAS